MQRLLLKALSVLATAMLLVVAAAGFSQGSTRPIKIIVMGDSFSAGNGAGGKYSEKGCYRSSNNYGQQYGRLLNPPATVKTVACSGAKFQDFFTEQPDRNVPRQRTQISGDEDIIFLTIGGNDAGFGDVVEQCLLPTSTSSSAGCDKALTKAEGIVSGAVPLKYPDGFSITWENSVSRVLLGVLDETNGNTKIILLGYPYLEGNPKYVYDGVRVGARLRGLNDLANKIYERTVAKYSSRFMFKSMTSTFKGHEPYNTGFDLNGRKEWFIKPFTIGVSRQLYYHPNPDGWTAEAKALFDDPNVPHTSSS